MPKRAEYLHGQTIPPGLAVYEERLEIVGIQHYREFAIKFVGGSQCRLELEPDPENLADRNAINVIGVWKAGFSTKRAQIGHVPALAAGVVAACALAPAVTARLSETYLADNGFVVIAFQLLGPEDRLQDYRLKAGDEPTGYSREQREQREEEKALIAIYRKLSKQGRVQLMALAETLEQTDPGIAKRRRPAPAKTAQK